MWIDMGRHDFVANVAMSKPKAIPMFFFAETSGFQQRTTPNRGASWHRFDRIETRAWEGAESPDRRSDTATGGRNSRCDPKETETWVATRELWLVVDLPLWKIWKSVGMIIPNNYMEKQNMFQTTKQNLMHFWGPGLFRNL